MKKAVKLQRRSLKKHVKALEQEIIWLRGFWRENLGKYDREVVELRSGSFIRRGVLQYGGDAIIRSVKSQIAGEIADFAIQNDLIVFQEDEQADGLEITARISIVKPERRENQHG